VSSSSSEALIRLGSALAASGALHLGAGLAVEALPWDADGVAEHRPAKEAPPLRVDFRVAQPAAAAPSESRESKPAAPRTERYHLARELDVRPAPREPIEPVYPNDAFLKDIPGRVVVRLFISESGQVEKALIVHAEPPGYFEEAVQQAFRAAHFTPAMKYGRPVKAQVVLEVRYDAPLRAAQ
jgi:protein TonB